MGSKERISSKRKKHIPRILQPSKLIAIRIAEIQTVPHGHGLDTLRLAAVQRPQTVRAVAQRRLRVAACILVLGVSGGDRRVH